MSKVKVLIEVAVPDDVEIDVCNVINRLINIGLEDAADTADDATIDDGESADILKLSIAEPTVVERDYFEGSVGLGILDHVADIIANRHDTSLQKVQAAIDTYDPQSLYDNVVGPMIDDAETELAFGDDA